MEVKDAPNESNSEAFTITEEIYDEYLHSINESYRPISLSEISKGKSEIISSSDIIKTRHITLPTTVIYSNHINEQFLSNFINKSVIPLRNQYLLYKTNYINKLHKYNNIKDACDILMNTLANTEKYNHCTMKEMYEKYNVS